MTADPMTAAKTGGNDRASGSASKPGSVPQRAVHLATSRLSRPPRRIQRVLHLLPRMIQTGACLLGRPFLMAGTQTSDHQGTGSDQQRLAHHTLSESGDRPNGPATARLHRPSNVCVGNVCVGNVSASNALVGNARPRTA
jgi:hypothetical protein